MKIFVSAKWEDRERAKYVMEELTKLGHTITYDWTKYESDNPTDLSMFALRDMGGVFDCDCLVVITIDDYSYRGLYCEVGAALVWWKPVYIIGNAGDRCIFWNHPCVRKIASIDALLAIFVESVKERNE